MGFVCVEKQTSEYAQATHRLRTSGIFSDKILSVIIVKTVIYPESSVLPHQLKYR